MRQSMDRFGDDLCQLILSYLPFEDRFRYECVSRQWRRLIFRSQRVLTLEYNWASFFLPTLREGLVFATNRSILKKCQQITEISVNRFVNNRDVVFQVINKYCHNLSAIESDFDGMSARTVTAFCHTFGAQLKKLTFHSNNETNREVFRRCLRSIHVLNIRPFNDLSLLFTGNEVLVHKLREICFTYSNEDSQRIGIFCETNKQTLESIEVTFSANSLTPKSINQLFKGLSKLSELKVLVISCQSEVDDTLVCKCLQLLAAKYVDSKSAMLTIYGILESGPAVFYTSADACNSEFTSLKCPLTKSSENMLEITLPVPKLHHQITPMNLDVLLYLQDTDGKNITCQRFPAKIQ
ncbi:unnamed protein product [Oppiella nova]|uniref:F-box domain-containing protein n=1 Tax=Oppiella nova TaxID=334625 RepID=A0A7R9QI77_9ACAR|nr:unnamed protein product [Oppiella nova]CAG2165529.1 unnamed protein product [Oppiella nova]